MQYLIAVLLGGYLLWSYYSRRQWLKRMTQDKEDEINRQEHTYT